MAARVEHEAMTATQQPLTIRVATVADAAELRELALLDSRRLPAGPHLVAEVGDRIRAAYSLTTDTVVADPFVPTADLVQVLRAHARTHAPRRRLGRFSLRPALA
jgi:hypothetical protein